MCMCVRARVRVRVLLLVMQPYTHACRAMNALQYKLENLQGGLALQKKAADFGDDLLSM
jgi:hypothetical protein